MSTLFSLISTHHGIGENSGKSSSEYDGSVDAEEDDWTDDRELLIVVIEQVRFEEREESGGVKTDVGGNCQIQLESASKWDTWWTRIYVHDDRPDYIVPNEENEGLRAGSGR
jgi:hypothetical protein